MYSEGGTMLLSWKITVLLALFTRAETWRLANAPRVRVWGYGKQQQHKECCSVPSTFHKQEGKAWALKKRAHCVVRMHFNGLQADS